MTAPTALAGRCCYFAIAGDPRTKKNSGIATMIRPRGRAAFPTVLPSHAYQAWFKIAMSQAPIIKGMLSRGGFMLPIQNPVAVKAVFYLKTDCEGDLCGYMQALGDLLQTPTINAKTGRQIRNGAGIIQDDKQIRSWDGSRVRRDREHPRIEVTITILEHELQGELF